MRNAESGLRARRERHRAHRKKTRRGMETGALAQTSDSIKARGARTYFEAEIPEQRPASERVHRCWRHFSGRALPALGFRAGSRSARPLPGIAHGKSVALYVFPAIRRAEKFGRNARA